MKTSTIEKSVTAKRAARAAVPASPASALILPIDEGMEGLPIWGRDHIQGPKDAAVILLEYGDYECPYTRDAHPLVLKLQEKFDGKLQFAYRHFPLPFHQHAQDLAVIAEYAGLQNKFWEMHTDLMTGQIGDEGFSRLALEQRAERLGIPPGSVSRELFDRVTLDHDAGVDGGVTGTPTFFINGKPYAGPTNYPAMAAALSRSEGVFID